MLNNISMLIKGTGFRVEGVRNSEVGMRKIRKGAGQSKADSLELIAHSKKEFQSFRLPAINQNRERLMPGHWVGYVSGE